MEEGDDAAQQHERVFFLCLSSRGHTSCMAVHFKFKSFRDYDTISFDGSFIAVGELKRSIIAKKKLGKSNDFDLIITNAQTNEGTSLLSP